MEHPLLKNIPPIPNDVLLYQYIRDLTDEQIRNIVEDTKVLAYVAHQLYHKGRVQAAINGAVLQINGIYSLLTARYNELPEDLRTNTASSANFNSRVNRHLAILGLPSITRAKNINPEILLQKRRPLEPQAQAATAVAAA